METLQRTKIKALLASEPGVEVLAKGWVRTKRGNKQVKFIALNDGSTINNIQIVANTELFDEELLKRVTTGGNIDRIPLTGIRHILYRDFFNPDDGLQLRDTCYNKLAHNIPFRYNSMTK